MWEHRAENAAALSEKSLWESRRWTGFSFLWEAAKDLAAVTSHTPQLSPPLPLQTPGSVQFSKSFLELEKETEGGLTGHCSSQSGAGGSSMTLVPDGDIIYRLLLIFLSKFLKKHVTHGHSSIWDTPLFHQDHDSYSWQRQGSSVFALTFPPTTSSALLYSDSN